jgi:hypothetical protein
MPADIAQASGYAMAAQPPDYTESHVAFRMRSGAREFAFARRC